MTDVHASSKIPQTRALSALYRDTEEDREVASQLSSRVLGLGLPWWLSW